MRSSRQVHPKTPYVLDSADGLEASSAERKKSSGSTTARRPSRNTQTSPRSTRRTQRSTSASARGAQILPQGIKIKLFALLALAVVLCGVVTALYFSSIFPIKQISVAGNVKLMSGYVTKLADVPEGSTFFRTDKEGIRARLLADPWIREASVESGFPDTLILRIAEQPIAAVVSIVPETANDSVQQWAIAEDGCWIGQIDNDSISGVRINLEELVKIPKIKDISAAVRPQSGVLETDEGVVNALAMLRGFSSEMRGMVAVISAPDAVKTTFTLYNNVGVAFGAAEDIEAKERAIATLLAEYEGTITYINVRVADRATYRATE
ncbi:MAG: FtsQ-type POTRA domain-containing protein [Coriobacteriales bacterium]|nr:FtsQ-type POTRA domain-containing protein [Coriobacteriales bacterium]